MQRTSSNNAFLWQDTHKNNDSCLQKLFLLLWHIQELKADEVLQKFVKKTKSIVVSIHLDKLHCFALSWAASVRNINTACDGCRVQWPVFGQQRSRPVQMKLANFSANTAENRGHNLSFNIIIHTSWAGYRLPVCRASTETKESWVRDQHHPSACST